MNEQEQTISNALKRVNSAIGDQEPPEPGEVWSRVQFRRRYRGRVPRQSVTRNDTLVAVLLALWLLSKVTPGWVILSLLWILSAALTAAVLLWSRVSRAFPLTDRD